jgi:hypothetical protein
MHLRSSSAVPVMNPEKSEVPPVTLFMVIMKMVECPFDKSM